MSIFNFESLEGHVKLEVINVYASHFEVNKRESEAHFISKVGLINNFIICEGSSESLITLYTDFNIKTQRLREASTEHPKHKSYNPRHV